MSETKTLEQMTEEIKSIFEGQYKPLVERMEAETKKFGEATEETKATLAKMDEDMDTLTRKIQDLVNAQKRMPQGQETDKKDGEPTPEAKAFDTYLRQGKSNMEAPERKALASASDPDGGIFVMQDFRLQLIQKLRDQTFIRQLATTINTTKASIGFPTFDYDGSLEWTAESEQISEESLGNMFGKEQFVPHKLARIFRLPQELVDDSAVDLQGLLTNHFAMRYGEIEENAYLNGNGVGKPLGLLNSGITVRDTAGAAVVGDDLIDITMDIRHVYRKNAAWLMHRNLIRAIRKLKNAVDGSYIWQPGIQAGQPSTILSFPVYESEYFPDKVAAGNAHDPLALFGDFSHYWIIDRQDMSIQRLTEKYAEYDQIGYKLRKRTDAAPTLREPFRILGRK